MHDNRGYILIGILFSLAVLGIIVAPLSLSLVTSARQSESAGIRLMALELAQGKLEELTAKAYGDIGPVERENFPAPYGSFSFQVDVSQSDVYSTLKNITVTVYYPDPGTGEEKSVFITGARADR